jgi:hypothetical protein
MIFPWHTDLFQPGRTVCVVFRASPLIWPTLFGATHAPRPLCFLRRQQGAPPVVFRTGLWVLVGNNKSAVIPEGVSLSGTLYRIVHWGPRSALSLRRG